MPPGRTGRLVFGGLRVRGRRADRSQCGHLHDRSERSATPVREMPQPTAPTDAELHWPSLGYEEWNRPIIRGQRSGSSS